MPRLLPFFLAFTCGYGAVTGCAEAGVDAAIELTFCKREPGACRERVIELAGAAESTLAAAVYTFTLIDVADALIDASARGVKVWALIEGEQGANDEVIARLRASGVFVKLDGNPAIMHHKFLVVDNRLVATGSFNWTQAADERNDENFLVLHAPATAARFGEEFEALWAEGE